MGGSMEGSRRPVAPSDRTVIRCAAVHASGECRWLSAAVRRRVRPRAAMFCHVSEHRCGHMSKHTCGRMSERKSQCTPGLYIAEYARRSEHMSYPLGHHYSPFSDAIF